jgi:uncharacterized protein
VLRSLPLQFQVLALALFVQSCTPSDPPAAAASTQAQGGTLLKKPAGRCLAPFSERALPAVPPASNCPVSPEPLTQLPTGTLRFVDAATPFALRVERAESDSERSLGLMYRTAMDEDAGMLFTWPTESRRSFWMKNTCLALDMMFIGADDVIVGILEQVPTLNTLSRTVPCSARRVLEVNAGFSRRHGIAPGQRIAVDF